jgi:hypothetical protein
LTYLLRFKTTILKVQYARDRGIKERGFMQFKDMHKVWLLLFVYLLFVLFVCIFLTYTEKTCFLDPGHLLRPKNITHQVLLLTELDNSVEKK